MVSRAVLCLLLLATSASAEQIRLSDMDLSRVASAWNSIGVNRSLEGDPLKIDGKTYKHGVSVHPPSRIAVETRGAATRFHAIVGIDDEIPADEGTVEFRVYGDGRVLWKSGLIRGSSAAKTVDVDLRAIRRVELVVTSAGRYSLKHRDHADWADAWFEYDGPPPRTEKRVARVTTIDAAATRIAAVRRELVAYREDPEKQAYWKTVRPQVLHPASLVEPADRDPLDVLLRRTGALLEHLEDVSTTPQDTAKPGLSLPALRRLFDHLRNEADRTPVASKPSRETLCQRLLAVRRRIAMANPLLNFDKILFIKRHPLPGHYTAGHNICDQYFGFHAIPGGGLFVLENPFGEGEPQVRNVLADANCANGRFAEKPLPTGAFLSPELSCDGQTVLFAWTQAKPSRYLWSKESTYAIFRVGIDPGGAGTDLRQLTDGPFNDFDPCCLPNGRIAFVSDRRGGYGRCHGRPVPAYTLHTMLATGDDIVCISPHETNEWHPSVDNFGRILYTRWDYVDRGDIQAHHPWVITPDGRDPRAVHGNYRRSPESSPCAEMDLRAIPGTAKYIGTAAPHHGQAYGSLVTIDPTIVDDDALSQLKRFTPEVPFPQSENGGPAYATAWPLDEYFCLCAYDEQADDVDSVRNRHGIYLVDAFGNKELLYRDPEIACLSPIPLRPRTRPTEMPHYSAFGRPESQADARQVPPVGSTTSVLLMNVYDSHYTMPKDAKIAYLRVLQLLPKTTPSANQPRIGHGSQKNARRVLGTTPVEPDGSAHFLVPTGVPIYFQALDARGRAVQSMRSDTHAFPGRGLVCQGCHEPRHQAPDFDTDDFPLALRRRPLILKPDAFGSNPLNYPQLVQTILDDRCVSCHAKKAQPDLRRGDPARNRRGWFTSYDSLKPYAFFYNDQVFTAPRTTPGQFGARASKLLKLLEDGHEGVKLTPEELYRITLWLDCNSDFFGSYENLEAQARGQVVHPRLQ